MIGRGGRRGVERENECGKGLDILKIIEWLERNFRKKKMWKANVESER